MGQWPSDELEKIEAADELPIAPVRRDGILSNPVTIWVVRLGAGGIEKDAAFVDADHGANDEIDAAYRDKYRRYADGYVPPMIGPEARATLRLAPRSA